MGANQSTPPRPVAQEKLLIERLKALDVKDDASTSTSISEKEALKNTNFRAPWTSLSVPDVGNWERQLLQDPKNRYAPSPSHSSPLPSHSRQARTLGPLLRRPKDCPHLPFHRHLRPACLQCQDSLRGGTDHQSETERTMLALRFYECVSGCADEEI